MARSWMRPPGALAWLAAALLGAGCGKSDTPQNSRSGEEEKEPPAAKPAPAAAPATPRPPDLARLHQSFLQATRKDPPPDQRPPDVTRTGKSVGKLYGEVVRLWDGIRFARPDGTRIHYRAVLDTELGEIEIALDADRAPNHVRNFIALC